VGSLLDGFVFPFEVCALIGDTVARRIKKRE
jgi:hypothetical protein